MRKGENHCGDCGGKFGLVHHHAMLKFCRKACKDASGFPGYRFPHGWRRCSHRARDGHSADNLLRKRSCRPGHDERGSSI
jgi:hypothetical protein